MLALERLAERYRLCSEVDEHEPLPRVEVNRPQRERGAVELVLVDERRSDQPAVVGVAPRVVRAFERPLRMAIRLGVAQPRPAMAADVVEPVEPAVLVHGRR